jgi:hypothetical protein
MLMKVKPAPESHIHGLVRVSTGSVGTQLASSDSAEPSFGQQF